jgi:uncharacterized RmlC-like cupin family protein
MSILSRRALLGSGAAGGILTAVAAVAADGTFGNPDQPAEGAVNVTNPKALIDPGPQDPGLAGNEPAFLSPPATDVNGMPQFWTSFNLAPKRIQNGGWARQITQDDFKISTTIAGVNMRLGPGGVRELHWHQQAEWAIMTYGNCRVTILDESGRPEVADVKEGDLWYFPAGFPHSLQGWTPTAASLSSLSITVTHRNSTPCWSPTGSRIPRRRYLLKTLGSRRRCSRTFPCTTSGSTRAIPPCHRCRRSRRKWRRPRASHPIRSCSRSPMCTQAGRQRAERCGLPTAPTSSFRKQLPRRWSRSSPAGCETCIGIPMPTNGTTG